MKERKESQQTNYARHRIGVPAAILSPHFSAQACCVCILGILIKLAIRRSFLFFFLLVRSPTQLPPSISGLRVGAQMQLSLSENCFIFQPLLFNYTFALALLAGAGTVSLSVSRRCCHLWTCEICVLLVKRSKSLYPYGNGIPITSEWWLIVGLKENVWEKKRQKWGRNKNKWTSHEKRPKSANILRDFGGNLGAEVISERDKIKKMNISSGSAVAISTILVEKKLRRGVHLRWFFNLHIFVSLMTFFKIKKKKQIKKA